MGMFSLDVVRRLRIPLFSDQQRFVLEEYASYADDNTEEDGTIDVHSRKNIIGYHAFPSLKKMSQYYGKSYTSLIKAKQELIDMEILKEAEYQLNNSTITYCINFSKLFRLGDYYATLRSYKLNENDEKVKKFFQSAFKTYEDDFITFPVRTFRQREKGRTIDDWETLVDAGDDALEEYWRTYREKSIGAAEHNTNTSNTTKGHAIYPSMTNDNINHQPNDNQNCPKYPYSIEQYATEEPLITKKEIKIFKEDFERFTHTTLHGKKIWLEFSEKSINSQGKFDMDIITRPIKSYKEKNRFKNSKKGKQLYKTIQEYNSTYVQVLHYLIYKKHHPDFVPTK